MGKKIVYHIHGAEFDKFSKRHKKEVSSTLRKIDCVIALSQYWKSFFEREFDFHNVRILPNVIPSREYCNKSIEKPFHALFLGYLGERKGIYDLLQTIAEHKDELRGNFIMHVGGNGEIDNVKKFIQAKGIQDIVRFEGWVNGEEKVRLLSKCHFYILPSYAEGLPISILEAMSYQMPILSTPVGGIPEIVENGVNGFLSVPGNHEALYKNIRTLIDNPSQVKEMGRQSYLRVKKHFAENVQKELDTIYQELLK